MKIIPAILLSVCLVIPVLGQAGEQITFYNDTAKKAYANLAKEMKKERSPVQMFKGGEEVKKGKESGEGKPIKVATNCEEYLPLLSQGFEPADNTSQKISGSEYNICKIFEYLEKSESYSKDFWMPNITDEIYTYFDMKKIYSSILGKTRKSTLKNIVNTDEKFGSSIGKNIKINYGGENPWYYEMNIIAKGNFDGDSKADVLIEFKDHSLGKSSYYDDQVYVLTKKSDNDEIEPLETERKAPPAASSGGH